MATPIKTRVVNWMGGGLIGVATTLAVNHISEFEGYSSKVYVDPVGIQTYCYGETSKPNPNKTYSRDYCDFLLSKRASEYIRKVRSMVPMSIYISPYELAAWASFAYNVGISNFQSSTALRLLKQARRRAACNQLPRWKYGNGKVLQGLVKRRAVEQELCLKGASENGHDFEV